MGLEADAGAGAEVGAECQSVLSDASDASSRLCSAAVEEALRIRDVRHMLRGTGAAHSGGDGGVRSHGDGGREGGGVLSVIPNAEEVEGAPAAADRAWHRQGGLH